MTDAARGHSAATLYEASPDGHATLDRADARGASEQCALESIRGGMTTIEYYHLPAEPGQAEEPA